MQDKKKKKKEIESDTNTQLFNYRNPYPMLMKAKVFKIKSVSRLRKAKI